MTGRREDKKARTRATIIEVGLRLMHEHGYDAVTTTQIARAAGVVPATLFNYFPTKASIVFADDALWDPPQEAPEVGSTPAETLCGVLLAMVDQPAWTKGADDPLTAMRFDLVRREPALAAEQVSRAFGRVPLFADLVQRAHPEVSRADAVAVAGATVGAVVAALTWVPGEPVRPAVEDALRAVGADGCGGECRWPR